MFIEGPPLVLAVIVQINAPVCSCRLCFSSYLPVPRAQKIKGNSPEGVEIN